MTQYTSLGESLEEPCDPGHSPACVLGEPLGHGYRHVCSLCLYPVDQGDVACRGCGISADDDDFEIREYTEDDCRCNEITKRDYEA
jgi:hypothetical protein